jgi:hypothetical protein
MRTNATILVLIGPILLLLSQSSLAQNSHSYVVHQWPQDIDQIPCEAWKHNGPHSWTLDGTIFIDKQDSANENPTYVGGQVGAFLDRKCGSN